MTTPTRTPKLLVATFLAATVVLSATACNDDKTSPPATTQSNPASTTPPTTPATTTPTSPATPPPTIPAAATKGLTVTSAEAFARFYLAASDYMVATGDGRLVRQWADKACVACAGLATKYEQLYRAGGSVTGDSRTRILQVANVRLIRDDTAAVLIRGREGRQVETPRSGAKPTTYPGDAVTWDFTLAAASGHWVMYQMELK